MKCIRCGRDDEGLDCKTKWGVYAIVYNDLQTLLSRVLFAYPLFLSFFFPNIIF